MTDGRTLTQRTRTAWRQSQLCRAQSAAAYEAGDRTTGLERCAHFRRARDLYYEADRLAGEARIDAESLPLWSKLRRAVLND